MRFIDVFTGFPGSVHDARVFQNSPLFDRGRDLCRNFHLLGDSAYPNIRWLLTPFKQHQVLTREMRKYNTVHSSMRMKVEIAIGMLKGRFRRLKFVESNDITKVCSVVISACILHNICILNDDLVDVLEDNQPLRGIHLQAGIFDVNLRNHGIQKRNRIMNQLP